MGEMTKLDFEDKNLPFYLAKPEGPAKGGIIVIHEVWGLNQHTKDIADRFASEGYVALAPDLLSEVGITEELAGDLAEQLFDPERRNAAQPKLRELMAPISAEGFAEKTIEKVKACFDYLYKMPETKENIAVIGYCFGGTYSFALAVNEPKLKAAIPYYGHSDYSVDELKQIKCPVMAFYGENDEALVSKLDDLKDKMKQADVNFSYKVYENAGHAFFNDTNRFAYNKEASSDAWSKTLAFLTENL